MIEIHASAGNLLYDVLENAARVAGDEGAFFDFNGQRVEVRPGESFDDARSRLEEERGHPILDRAGMAEEARRGLEETKARQDAAIAEAGAPTEQEMRDAKVPWPESEDDLLAYVRALVDRPHDYGTCVHAMSMAALAAYRYVAGTLGVTGFQASCADMDILRRTRGWEHGFCVVNYADLLYPQYWNDERRGLFEAALRDDPERWRDEATRLLNEGRGVDTVRGHWASIVERCEKIMGVPA